MQKLLDHIDHQVATVRHAVHNHKMMTLVLAIKMWETRVSLTELKYNKRYFISQEYTKSTSSRIPIKNLQHQIN
jgi:phage baseplate assembly protein W